MTLLFGVFAIVLLLMGVSCEGNTIQDGVTNVSITITEEKLLEHSYIDGIASYDYKAVCNSHTPAQVSSLCSWTVRDVPNWGIWRTATGRSP